MHGPEGALPRTWEEAIPYVVWVVLVLGFGLELVAAFVRGEWVHFAVSLAGLVALMAAALHWKQAVSWARGLSPNLVVGALVAVLCTLAISPYVEQQRWPFAWQFAAPTSRQPPGFTQQEVDAKIAAALTSVNSQLAEMTQQINSALAERDSLKHQRDAALADAKRLSAQPPSIQPPVSGPVSWNLGGQLMVGSYNGQSYAVNGLIFQGTSEVPLHFKEAYLISGLTGHKAELLANVHKVGGYYPITAVDVPAGAPVQLDYIFKPELSVRDFFDQWGRFRFVVVYDDGSSFKYEFSEEEVRAQAQRQFPNAFGPQVTPKEQK